MADNDPSFTATPTPKVRVRVELQLGPDVHRLKLRLRDLTEATLLDKLASSLGISRGLVHDLERYSYTVATYVAVNTSSAYRSLYRSAEGNRLLFLRIPGDQVDRSQEEVPLPNHASSLRRKELPLNISGVNVCGRHDTGAEGNFMVEELASKLDLPINRNYDSLKVFSMGNGRLVRSTGIIETSCTFSKDPQTRVSALFHVFEKLVVSLVIGFPLLEATKTLSTFRNRLQCRPACANRLPMISLISSAEQHKRRLGCFIDGRQTYVNADSASDLDLMSASYVEAYGYTLDDSPACQKYVQLADSSILTTLGQVSASVTIGQGPSQTSYTRVFDVLLDLSSDVLLGEDSLEEMNIFTLHNALFVDQFINTQQLELNILLNLGPVAKKISLKLSKNAKISTQQQQPSEAKIQDNADMEELIRLDKLDDQIHELDTGKVWQPTNSGQASVSISNRPGHNQDSNVLQRGEEHDETEFMTHFSKNRRMTPIETRSNTPEGLRSHSLQIQPHRERLEVGELDIRDSRAQLPPPRERSPPLLVPTL